MANSYSVLGAGYAVGVTPDDPRLADLKPPYEHQIRAKAKELFVEDEVSKRMRQKMVNVNEKEERERKEAEVANRKRKHEEKQKWEGESLLFPFFVETRASGACSYWTRTGGTVLPTYGLVLLCLVLPHIVRETVADTVCSSFRPRPLVYISRLQRTAKNVLATGVTSTKTPKPRSLRRQRRTCTFWASGKCISLPPSPTLPHFPVSSYMALLRVP